MKIARIACKDGERYAVLEETKALGIKGEPFSGIELDGSEYPLSEIRLLAPCEPSKVVCVGKNYLDHINELKNLTGDKPENPLLFIKPSTSVIGPEEAVIYPSITERVDYEAELAVVIKKRAKNIRRDELKDYVLGYTCLNDVTARDVQIREGQWTRGKSPDTFCPIGPWIETEIEPQNLELKGILNGETKQHSNTELMIFPVDELIAFITQSITLLPGDVVATGTPAGIGPMQVGDVVEVEIEGIGTLRNPISK